jgi:hypothetical protein
MLVEADLQVTPTLSTGQQSTPPHPEMRPVSIEMPINQRYFYAFPSNNVSLGVFCQAAIYTTALAVAFLFFPQMRAAPSVILTAASTFQIPSAGSAYTPSSYVVGTTSPFSAEIDFTISSAVAGASGWVRSASTSGAIMMSSEL